MKRCFAYVRVSTPKQKELGTSPEQQRDAIVAYAKLHGLEIVGWYQEAKTAAKAGRGQFEKLITDLRRGRAEGLILHKIDRGARNLKDWARINDLMDMGVSIHFAHDSLDMTTRGGRLAADIQAVVAADYIRNLSEETRKGFYGRLKQGLYPLPAPRGYLDHGKGNPKTIDPVTGPIVREAFRLYSTGQFGLEQLRHELARRGLRSKNGTPLSLEAVSIMLRNPFYMGLIRIYKTNELFAGVHEPLVSRNLFERVQATIDGRVFARPLSHDLLFRRIVRCAACTRTLTGERQRGHVYYRCHGRDCRGTSLSEPAIDGVVRKVLGELQWTDGELGDLRDIVCELLRDVRQNEQNRFALVRRDEANVATKLERLTDLLISNDIDPEAYKERRARLLHEQQNLREQLGATDEPFWECVLRKFEQGNVSLSSYNSAPPSGKRDILISLGSNAIAVGKNLAITTDFPFGQLRDWRKNQNGAPCSDEVRMRHRSLPRKLRATKIQIAAFLATLSEE